MIYYPSPCPIYFLCLRCAINSIPSVPSVYVCTGHVCTVIKVKEQISWWPIFLNYCLTLQGRWQALQEQKCHIGASRTQNSPRASSAGPSGLPEACTDTGLHYCANQYWCSYQQEQKVAPYLFKVNFLFKAHFSFHLKFLGIYRSSDASFRIASYDVFVCQVD